MSFLKEGKTNWKYITIVVILALLVGGGILWHVIKQEFSLTQLPDIEKLEKAIISLELNLKTTKLAMVPEKCKYKKLDEDFYSYVEGDCSWSGVSFSPDGKRVAYIMTERGYRGQVSNMFMVVDGKKEKSYDSVYLLIFSPAGNRTVYKAYSRGGQGVVVFDGKEGKEYDEFSDLVFSPNSEKLAYGAEREGKYFSIINGVEGEGYGFYAWGFTFSPDSKHIAYKAGEKRGGKIFVVLDGEKGKSYDDIGPIVFSPNSEHLAYMAKEGIEGFLVFDGVEGKKYDYFSASYADGTKSPVFSPDSEHIAYVVKEKGEWFLIIDGEKKSSNFLSKYSPLKCVTFSSDSKHVAYVVVYGPAEKDDKKSFVVSDGKKGREYDDVCRFGPFPDYEHPVFSPDNKHIAYAAERYFPEGECLLGYTECEKRGEKFVVLDDKEGKPYGDIKNIVFSPDSKHIAYAAKKENKWILVVDRKESEFYDDIYTKSVFSSDNKYVYYGVRIDNELWWIVDEVE